MILGEKFRNFYFVHSNSKGVVLGLNPGICYEKSLNTLHSNPAGSSWIQTDFCKEVLPSYTYKYIKIGCDWLISNKFTIFRVTEV
jgi:hypothetical protein